MNKDRTEISEGVNACFEDQYKTLSEGSDSSVLIAHFGEFSQDLVNSISEGAESLLLESNTKKSLVKRIFSILIEGLQNIRLHGVKDSTEAQHGHVILGKDGSAFKVSFGNYVYNSNIRNLTTHLNKINSLDKPEVKQLYLDVLGNGFISEKGGAGLGFITIAMKSRNVLDFGFKKVSNEISYFYFNVRVSNEK